MLMEALRRICYSFLPPSSSVSPLLSTFLSKYSVIPLSSVVAAPAATSPSTISITATNSSPPGTATTTTNSAATLLKLVAFLALLSLLPSTLSMVKEADLQKMFKLRNENEWKSLWHQEKHVRCRDQLLTHMDWACQKDIYRLEKRFNKRISLPNAEIAVDPLGDVFVGKAAANMVIKPWSGYVRRKREDKSITDECCSAAGCSWEEYAEYCPAHRRLQTRRYAITNNKKRK